jgi:hypothetical protein
MTMRLLAHHAGEQGLTPLLLLLGGGGVPLLVAIGRARLAAARAKLTRKQGARRRCAEVAGSSQAPPASEPGVRTRGSPSRQERSAVSVQSAAVSVRIP